MNNQTTYEIPLAGWSKTTAASSTASNSEAKGGYHGITSQRKKSGGVGTAAAAVYMAAGNDETQGSRLKPIVNQGSASSPPLMPSNFFNNVRYMVD